MKDSKHPNKLPFAGVLTKLDAPSDCSPSGGRGHRVILTTAAAEDALDSLVGMAVGFASGWGGHNARQKCGVINQAWIEGDELHVSGHLFGHDFPEISEQMRKPGAEMGMSYELVNAHVKDMRESIWTLTKVTFTGAAILLRDKAAYRTTSISLSAAAAAEGAYTGNLSFVGEGNVRIAEVRTGRMHRWLGRLRTSRSGRC